MRGGRKGQAGRPVKFNDAAHVDLRNRVARWRARHPDRYRQQVENAKTRCRANKKIETQQGFRIYEIVDVKKRVVDIVVLRANKPAPAGAIPSPWLPREPIMDRAAATRIKRLRLAQLKRWKGD